MDLSCMCIKLTTQQFLQSHKHQNYEENSKKIGDYLGILDYCDFMRRVVLRMRLGKPNIISKMAQ